MEDPKDLDPAAPVYRGWKTYYDALPPKMNGEVGESSLKRATRWRQELLEVLEECCKTSTSGEPHFEIDPQLPKEIMSQCTPVLRGSSASGQIGVPSTAGVADNSDNTEKRRDGCVELAAVGVVIQSSGSVHPRRHEMPAGGEGSSVHDILESIVSREEPSEADSDPLGRTFVRRVAQHGEAACPEEGQDGQKTESISVQATIDSYCGTELGVTVGGLDEGTVTLGPRSSAGGDPRAAFQAELRPLPKGDRTNVYDKPELHGTVGKTGDAPSSTLGRSIRSGHPQEAGVRQPEAAKEFAVVLQEGGTESWGDEKVPAERPGAQETGMTSVRDVDGTIKGEEKDSENAITAKETDVRETARGVNARRVLQSGESFNDWGGRGCCKFVTVFGRNGTKTAPPGDILDQSPGKRSSIRGKLAGHVGDHVALSPERAVFVTSSGTESSYPRPPPSLNYSGLDALVEVDANEGRNRTGRQNNDSENLARPPAEGGSALETAPADDEESLGVEVGNSGIWEHVEGRAGTPTDGTTMNAMIAGILVSVPMPPEAFCAWKKRATPLSEQATGPDLDPSLSLFDGASGNGSDTDRNPDMSKVGVSNNRPVGDSRFVEECNRQNSVKEDTYPASLQNARRNRPGDQGPQSRLLDGSDVDGGENDYVDNDDVGVHVHGDHRQDAKPPLLDNCGEVDASPGARSKTWGTIIGKEGDTVVTNTASTIAGGRWRALRRLGRATAERDRLRHQLREFEDDDRRLRGGARRFPSPRSRPHHHHHRSPHPVFPPHTAAGAGPEVYSPWRERHKSWRGNGGGGGFGSIHRTRNTSESIFEEDYACSKVRSQRRGNSRYSSTQERGCSKSGGAGAIPSPQGRGIYSKQYHLDDTLGSSRESWCDAPAGGVGGDSGNVGNSGSFAVGGRRFVGVEKSPGNRERVAALRYEPWNVSADASARDSWERRKVACKADGQHREREHRRRQLSVGDKSKVNHVTHVPAKGLFRLPRLRSVRQAALILRGTVRPLVRLALLSAWKRWRRLVLNPLLPQGRYGQPYLARKPPRHGQLQPQPQHQSPSFHEAHDIPSQDHGESRPPAPIRSGRTSTDTRHGEKATVRKDDFFFVESEAAAGGDHRSMVPERAPVTFQTGSVKGSVDSVRAWSSSKDATAGAFRDMEAAASNKKGLVTLAAPVTARDDRRRLGCEGNLRAIGAEGLAKQRLQANLEPKPGVRDESDIVLRSSELSSTPPMDHRDAAKDGRDNAGSGKGGVGEDSRRLVRGNAGSTTTGSDKEEVWRRRKEVLLSFINDDDEGDDDANGGPADGEVPFLPAPVEVGDFRDPHGGAHVGRARGTTEKRKTQVVLSECHDEKGNVDDEKAGHGDGEYQRKVDGELELYKDRRRTTEKAVIYDAHGTRRGTTKDRILQLPPPDLTPLDDWPAPPTSGQGTVTPGSRQSRASVRRRTFSSDDECEVDNPASVASFQSFVAGDTLPPFSSTTPSLVYTNGAAQPSKLLPCSPSGDIRGPFSSSLRGGTGGSSRHSHGGRKATPWRPPGSPGRGLDTLATGGTSPKSMSTKPTPVSPLKSNRCGDNGDTVAGRLRRYSGVKGDLFAGRTNRRRMATTVARTPYPVRSRIHESKSTHLAPTASSRKKMKKANQVQSNAVAAPRKAFIPSGVAKAQFWSLSPPRFRKRRKPLARGDSAHPSAHRGGALYCDNQVLYAAPSVAYEYSRLDRSWGHQPPPRLGSRSPQRDQGEEPVGPWFDRIRDSPKRRRQSLLLDHRDSRRESSMPPVGNIERSDCDDMDNLFGGVGDVRPRAFHHLHSPRRRSSIGSPRGKDCSPSVTVGSDGICGRRGDDHFHRAARVAVGWCRPSVLLEGVGTREATHQEDRAHRYPRCFARNGQRSAPKMFRVSGETRYSSTIHGRHQRGTTIDAGAVRRARALLTRSFDEVLPAAGRALHQPASPRRQIQRRTNCTSG